MAFEQGGTPLPNGHDPIEYLAWLIRSQSRTQSIHNSVERFGCEDRVTLEKVRVLNLRFRGVICALNVFDDRFTASKEDLHERDAAKRDEYHGADRLA